VPESMKPRKIAIGSGDTRPAIEGTSQTESRKAHAA
jgi:hypothetical protein